MQVIHRPGMNVLVIDPACFGARGSPFPASFSTGDFLGSLDRYQIHNSITITIFPLKTTTPRLVKLPQEFRGILGRQKRENSTCRVGEVHTELLRSRPCLAGGRLATRIGLVDNGADVLPVEAFISLAALDVFQVAADRPLREELLSLLAADGLLPNQPRQP